MGTLYKENTSKAIPKSKNPKKDAFSSSVL